MSKQIRWTTFKLDKLVRDGIFDSMIESEGQRPEPSDGHLEDEQVEDYFKRKLKEELTEYQMADNSDERTEEAAGFLAAWDSLERFLKKSGKTISNDDAKKKDRLNALMVKQGVRGVDVKKLQEEIKAKLGEFDARRYVDGLCVREDQKWYKYYSAHPERFPVVKTWLETV